MDQVLQQRSRHLSPHQRHHLRQARLPQKDDGPPAQNSQKKLEYGIAYEKKQSKSSVTVCDLQNFMGLAIEISGHVFATYLSSLRQNSCCPLEPNIADGMLHPTG